MRRRAPPPQLLLLLAPPALLLPSAAPAASVGRLPATALVGGREVVFHQPPPGAGGGPSPPLVVALHGVGENATTNRSICNDRGRMAAHAAQLGFIAACPSGVAGSWNAAGCCGAAAAKKVDDVAFLRAVVAFVKSRAPVGKTYAIGFSNGAMLAWRLACEAADVFDGVAPSSGGWYGTPPFTASAAVPPPNGWITDSVACGSGNGTAAGSCGECWGAPSAACAAAVDRQCGRWRGVKLFCTSCATNHAAALRQADCSAADLTGYCRSRGPACWRPRGYPCAAPPPGYPILYTHGAADTNEPYDVDVAAFHHYAAAVLNCSGLGPLGDAAAGGWARGNVTCARYARCAAGRRVGFCRVAGLAHEFARPELQGFDPVSLSLQWWRTGAWPAGG